MYFNRKLKPPLLNTEMILSDCLYCCFSFCAEFRFRVAMGFMETFKKGESQTIIDDFNTLRLNIITEG